MKSDCKEYVIAKAADTYFTNIFRFELIQAEGEYVPYFCVQTNYRKPNGELETAALKTARQICDGQIAGLGYCTDKRIEENNATFMLGIATHEPEIAALLESAASTNAKKLKEAK